MVHSSSFSSSRSVLLACAVVLAVAHLAAATIPSDTRFFFPKECTLDEDRKCCPTFGQSDEYRCGGLARGSCQLALTGDYAKCNATVRLSHYWYSDYFDYACACNGNYWGIGCETCAPGWTGDDCLTAMPLRVRRDIDTLTDAERARYVQGVQLLAVTDHPYWPGEITMWRWLSAIHTWAKDPLNNTLGTTMLEEGYDIDYGHMSSGMLTWHRVYQWHFERYMQVVLDDETYAVPYWNWTKSTAGNILYDTAVSLTGGDGDPTSQLPWNCSVYDIDVKGMQCNCSLTTGPFADNFTTTGYWGVDMDQALYGLDGSVTYSTQKIQRAFGCLVAGTEAALGIPGDITLVDESLNSKAWLVMADLIQPVHSIAHIWTGWTMKLGGPPSDPIFFLHHSYVDQLLERWIRSAVDTGDLTVDNMLPLDGSQIGHNLDSCVTPMAPLTRHLDWLKPSYALGYTYDTWVESDPATASAYIATGTESYYTTWAVDFAASATSAEASTSLMAHVSTGARSSQQKSITMTAAAATEHSTREHRRARAHRKLRARATAAALQP